MKIELLEQGTKDRNLIIFLKNGKKFKEIMCQKIYDFIWRNNKLDLHVSTLKISVTSINISFQII